MYNEDFNGPTPSKKIESTKKSASAQKSSKATPNESKKSQAISRQNLKTEKDCTTEYPSSESDDCS